MTAFIKQVLLVGAGHAHLHVASHAGEFIRRRYLPVLINPGLFWYSGMATGLLGGQYAPARDTVDPRPLIEQAGGRYIDDRIVAIDTSERTVTFSSGENVSYDLISLNIGSEVDMAPITGSKAGAWPVKPIANLWRLRRHLEERFRHPDWPDPLQVLIIGGGATGCEIAANIDALARRHRASARLRICTSNTVLLPEAPAGASRRLQQVLADRGITVDLERRIKGLKDGLAVDSLGRESPYQVAVIATGLRAPGLIKTLQLPADPHEGLTVTAALHSPADLRVFGAGDCIQISGYELPKLGVFGFREGPVLLRNLLAAIDNKPLQHFRPQQHYLRILNLGQGKSLAIRGRFYWYGHLSQWLKHVMDNRFVTRYKQDGS